ncbi:hypothetical protein RJ639_021612 [Escallonia herrerae]|uniref:WRC domain-containing protein n=1 Tax=Escallonia herrerae TaxID=1293975 RepID=A0AA89AGJ9_9ASTE|nr:hypothetical protein RJ639_021612 [Escallonia herrerae]
MWIRKRCPPSSPPPDRQSSTALPSPDPFHHSGSGDENPWQQNRRFSFTASSHQEPANGVREGGAVEPKRLNATDRRVWYDPSAETSTGSSSCSSSSPREGHWFEEDKIFPLKKRRVSIESNGTRAMELKRKNIHVKQRTSKCISEKSIDGDYVVAKNGAKEVMEGVRCSRRNGRGWRCCQPTAVGFSVCEHHPDLGRLRPKGKRLSAGNRSLKPKEDYIVRV